MDEAVSPYSRFVRAESSHWTEVSSALEDISRKVTQLTARAEQL